jgi:hypothetical protein
MISNEKKLLVVGQSSLSEEINFGQTVYCRDNMDNHVCVGCTNKFLVLNVAIVYLLINGLTR